VNCERALEGLGHLLSGGETKRPRRWKVLRESLNVSKPYIDFISDRSVAGRHGQTGPVNISEAGEAQMRAWKLVARFLEFRKRGNVNLEEPEFPLL